MLCLTLGLMSLLLFPAPANDSVSEAVNHYRAGRYQQALDLLTPLHQKRPDDAQIIWYLAVAHHMQGNLDAALALYPHLYENTYRRSDAYYNTACILSVKKDLDAALLNLDQAYRLGYNNRKHMEQDTDLDNLRPDPRFKYPPQAEERTVTLADGTTYTYLFIPPTQGTNQDRPPTLLALAPGTQARNAVDWAMGRYWGVSASMAGFATLSPLGPPGGWYTPRARRHLGELLSRLREAHTPNDDRFHLLGASNGGMVAYHMATSHPDFFADLTVLPGCPRDEEGFKNLHKLKGMKVRSFFNDGDSGWWLARIERTHQLLMRHGANLEIGSFTSNWHPIGALFAGELIKRLEK